MNAELQTAKRATGWSAIRRQIADWPKSALLALVKDLHDASPENRDFLRVRQVTRPMKPAAATHWHQVHHDELVKFLDVNLSTGLSAEEVARRGTPAWLKFLKQFNQPLVYILLVAVGVTGFLGEWVDVRRSSSAS